MSSLHIQNLSTTVPGNALFKIKLDHKFSNFNPKAQPAIDIEAINSGLYALKRLATILDAGTIHASSLLNPHNTIFPSPPKQPKRSDNSTTTNTNNDTTETIASIQEATAVALVPTILNGLDTLIESVTELNLSQVSSITLAIALVSPLKDKDSLNETQQKTVFNNSYEPTDDDLITQIKKEQASAIQSGKQALQEKLTAAGATEENIQEALEEYENTFAQDFFDTYVSKQIMTYRSSVGACTLQMMQDMSSIATQPPEPTQDNVDEVNARVVLLSIFDGLKDAVQKNPALGGNDEIIKTQLALSKYLTQSSLSEDDIQTIYTASVLPQQSTLDEYLPSRDGALYREGIVSAYQTAVQNLNTVRLSIENEKETLENQLELFQKAQNCFSTWAELTDIIVKQKEYTSEIVTAAMESYAGLMNLSQIYGYLQQDEKTLIEPYVNSILELKVKNNDVSMSGFIARTIVFQELADYTLQNFINNKSTIQTYLNNKGQLFKTNYSFFSDIGQDVSTIATTSLDTYLTTAQSRGQQGQTTYYIPNFANFVEQIKIADNEELPTEATEILNTFSQAATEHIQKLQQQITDLEEKYEEFDPANASFTDERANAVTSWLNSESLGSAFIYFILNSQLPKQSILLDPLIEEINFNNLAANAINKLLEITNTFSTTSVYYNFSSYLVESKEGENLFCGDYYETLVAVSKEKDHIFNDVNLCRRASVLVEELMKKINTLSGASSSQITEMRNATANYNYALNITLNQLNVLNALLTSLTITPEMDNNTVKENVFKIVGMKDWMSTLASLEGFIANGFPNISITGGLGTLFTQIQSDQQNYTTQSQTQQLNLQNQMSSVQQEWTLVSTSMQVLNKILTHLAGEIYPN
ncbi:CT620/CT621 family type III secretion system effector [Chlamydia avium]|uniref:Effector from type III secretion system family protein n=1 Tax=Chlamydia avium TaxID=1457141 RepID=A0ABN0MT91_9CHLA|nr:CT620/CT621 family type III secretion system effector [Chlamydia avium]EPP36241.1 effector from type III secretion system family protein [Chlamydia psittaci 10_743_SC13]EPP38710.1 effector from type III secretion system family protein [Chlamydia avium]